MKTLKEVFITASGGKQGFFLGSEYAGSNYPQRISGWDPAIGSMYLTYKPKSSQSVELLVYLFPFTKKQPRPKRLGDLPPGALVGRDPTSI